MGKWFNHKYLRCPPTITKSFHLFNEQGGKKKKECLPPSELAPHRRHPHLGAHLRGVGAQPMVKGLRGGVGQGLVLSQGAPGTRHTLGGSQL